MILKNWYKFVGYGVFKKGTLVNKTGTTSSPSTLHISFVGTSYQPSMSQVATTKTSCGIVFGTGNTPVTIDDYKLSGEQITGIAATCAVEVASDDDGITATSVCSITNNNSEAITVSECGLMTKSHSGSSNYEDHFVLVERTVLDTPVTIPAGGVGQVTYTIRMNYPT